MTPSTSAASVTWSSERLFDCPEFAEDPAYDRNFNPIRKPLPTAGMLATRALWLEVLAIAAAVFALFAFMELPPELAWLVILVLAIARRCLRDSGFDPVLVDRAYARRTRRADPRTTATQAEAA